VPGHALEPILNPGSIAIVGASADPAKRGYQILQALGESGYRGQVLPVNPKGGSIHGHQVAPSIESLPVAADLAVLCTPAGLTPQLIAQCGQRGIGAAVVLAVGFKESGPEGTQLEERLAEEGRTHGVRIIGPNTSGILNLHARLNLIGARGVRPGGIALLVQSGNMALALMNEVTERTSDGVSICVGIGNETDIGFADTLEYLAQHDETRTIVVHAEGMRDPRRFLDVASAMRGEKPIVMIKGARSPAGAVSALSHTGAVAGPYDRFRAGLRQAGIIEITRTDELLHAAETLGNQRSTPAGSGVAVVTDGGGHGALAVDTLTEMGVSLAELSEDTKASLRRLLGTAAAVSNPVDLAGAADGDPLVFARAVELVSRDASAGSILVVGLFGGYGIRFADSLTGREVAAAQSMGSTTGDVGLVVHSMYAGHASDPLEVLRSLRVPVIGSLDVACRCIAALHERGRAVAARPWRDAGVGALREHHGPGRVALTEPEARRLLRAHGLTFAP
jgi:acetyltransferase